MGLTEKTKSNTLGKKPRCMMTHLDAEDECMMNASMNGSFTYIWLIFIII